MQHMRIWSQQNWGGFGLKLRGREDSGRSPSREALAFKQIGEALEKTSSTEGGGGGLGQEEEGLV